jgi:hypothetical protein
MKSRYDDLIRELRAAAKPERPAPAEFELYLAKVRLQAYEVTDRDIDELKEAEFTEDEISSTRSRSRLPLDSTGSTRPSSTLR